MKPWTNPGHSLKLILASGSARRRQLLVAAGYKFEVDPPHATAECGIRRHESPPEMVARLAFQKARDVAARYDRAVIIGADTVVECCGQILGKPANRRHAGQMLQQLRGRLHRVYTSICLWRRPGDETMVRVDVSELRMADISDQQIEAYLDTGAWKGKAGAFGYQDEHDWLQIVKGSATNVVGLPMELFGKMLEEFVRDDPT